jgi:hypothetical protein
MTTGRAEGKRVARGERESRKLNRGKKTRGTNGREREEETTDR